MEESSLRKCISKYDVYNQQMHSRRAEKLFEKHDTIPALIQIHKIKQLFLKRKTLEDVMFRVGMFGIVAMFVQNELVLYNENTPSGASQMVQLLITISTLAIFPLLIRRYAVHLQILQLQNVYAPSTNIWMVFGHYILLEALLCGYHIPYGVSGQIKFQEHYYFEPNVNATCANVHGKQMTYEPETGGCHLTYHYNVEVLGVFMVCRLYMFTRRLRNSSGMYSHFVAFLGTLNNVNTMNPFFHFKMMFKKKPLRLIVPLFLYTTLFTAATIRLLEIPIQPELESFFTAIWLTIVTITSVGYGDTTPKTFLGRSFIVIFGILFGVLFVALINAVFFGALEMSRNEKWVKSVIDKTSWQRRIRDAAVCLIQTRYRLRHLGKGSERDKMTGHLYKCMRKFHSLVQTAPQHDLGVEEDVLDLSRRLEHEISLFDREEAKLAAELERKMKIVETQATLLTQLADC